MVVDQSNIQRPMQLRQPKCIFRIHSQNRHEKLHCCLCCQYIRGPIHKNACFRVDKISDRWSFGNFQCVYLLPCDIDSWFLKCFHDEGDWVVERHQCIRSRWSKEISCYQQICCKKGRSPNCDVSLHLGLAHDCASFRSLRHRKNGLNARQFLRKHPYPNDSLHDRTILRSPLRNCSLPTYWQDQDKLIRQRFWRCQRPNQKLQKQQWRDNQILRV